MDVTLTVDDVITTGATARCAGSAPTGRVAVTLEVAPSHPTSSMGLCSPSAMHSKKLPRSKPSSPHRRSRATSCSS